MTRHCLPTRVVGLGTGKCGTHSLATLFNCQHNSRVTHERDPQLSWSGSDDGCQHLLGNEENLFGDVGFYYLPYVQQIQSRFPDTKFVCLQRHKPDFERSFFAHVNGRDWFTVNRGSYWARCFPTYPGLELQEALSQYYDDYYARANALVSDHFQIFQLEHLNSVGGVLSILDFLEVRDPVINVGIRSG